MKESKNVQKILIITLSNLGDVVLTLPIFQAIIQKYPKAKIHVMVGPNAQIVFEGDSRIEKIIVYDKKKSWQKKWQLLKEIRFEKYDVLIDLRTSIFGLLGGAKVRNSYAIQSKKRLHRKLAHFKYVRKLLGKAIPEASFLQGRLTNSKTTLPQIFTNRSDRALILVSPGSKSDLKKWPAEHYAKLLDRLSLSTPCEIVFIGDKNDQNDIQKIKSLMASSALDLSGKTNFQELVAIINEAALLITNDSAPLHIADSLRVPTLAIFGPTDPRRYGPRYRGSLVASKVLFCAPCQKAQCRFGHECMTTLGVDEVYQKVMRIFSGQTQRQHPRILLVRLDRIGDVMLSMPAIAAIKENYPDAHISLMVRPQTRQLLEGHPLIDEVIVYDYAKHPTLGSLLNYFRFIQGIVMRRFDIAFVLNPSLRSNLIPYFAAIPYRVGFDGPHAFFLTHKTPDRRHEGKKHESEYTLDILRAFKIEPKEKYQPTFPIFKEHEEKISKVLSRNGIQGDQNIIALHPGASCPSKRWPIERFAQLGKKILQESPAYLVVIGGAQEKESGQILSKALGSRCVDLTGELDLKESAALLKRSQFLISNDSGPVHIAWAVNTRSITIFGRNLAGLSQLRWKALGAGNLTIQKDVGCVTCLAHQCTIDFECLKAVEVDEVFGLVQKMMVAYEKTSSVLS